MRRLLLLALAAVAVTAGAPAAADATTPCRDKIFNEWYKTGKVASTYPLGCYRDALKHVPSSMEVYSSLSDDIRLGLQAAVARANGKTVPDEVGNGVEPTSSPVTTTKNHTPTSPTDTAPSSPKPGSTTTTQQSVPVSSKSTGGSSGLPLPVIVLGGVALVLVGSGGIGLAIRRFRRGNPGV